MSHNILLVENDPGIARALARYLETMGYEVTQAPDGETGLSEATGRPFDLCIMDVILPGISGAETYRRIKAQQPSLEAIFINADETAEQTSDFLHFSLPPERMISQPLEDVGQLTRLIVGILGPPVH